MGSNREALVAGFERGLEGLKDAYNGYDIEEAYDLGLRAARTAIAPAMWRTVLGELLTTAQVADLLGITRQAIAKRVAANTLVGLPGKRTTHFPAWQFDTMLGEVRPVVREVVGVFAEEMGRFDPQVIAAWAATPQEDLDGLTVVQWLQKHDPQHDHALIASATRTAARLGE